MKVTMIGVDLAKNIFQVCGVNQAGNEIFNKAMNKKKLIELLLLKHPDVTVAMEACSGSNPLGRKLEKHDFKVLLIPPNHVKPFVKGNKNDRNDAFAITEAARRPGMHFVRPKTLEQTDLIQVHRLRERRINDRTRMTNQIRGFLKEYRMTVPVGLNILKERLSKELSIEGTELTIDAKLTLEDAYEEWLRLDKSISKIDKRLSQMIKNDEQTTRLMTLKGVGEVISSAFKAVIGDGTAYKNGRHCAANIGLVPKEHSSGGKQKLGGITKRGNSYLRKLLVQGANSVLAHASRSSDRLSSWAKKVKERRGHQIAVVAVANKMARILWSMSYHQTTYNGQVDTNANI